MIRSQVHLDFWVEVRGIAPWRFKSRHRTSTRIIRSKKGGCKSYLAINQSWRNRENPCAKSDHSQHNGILHLLSPNTSITSSRLAVLSHTVIPGVRRWYNNRRYAKILMSCSSFSYFWDIELTMYMQQKWLNYRIRVKGAERVDRFCSRNCEFCVCRWHPSKALLQVIMIFFFLKKKRKRKRRRKVVSRSCC